MNKRHRELMDALRAAKPSTPISADEWESSGMAEKLLGQIYARIEAEEQMNESSRSRHRFRSLPRSLPRLLRVPRVRLVAGGVAVAVIALFLGLWLVPHLSQVEQTRTSSASTAATSNVVSAQTFTREEALGNIAALFKEFPGFIQGEPDVTPKNAFESAQLLGLVRGSELSINDVGEPTTRQELALWIWRAWSPVLAKEVTPAEIADGSTLSPEQLEAAEAVAALGIMEVDAAGAFHPGGNLTGEEADRAFARLRTLLE